jgi:hypothetical protein
VNDDGIEEIFIGPIGLIRTIRDNDPRAIHHREASVIAHAAIACDDLIALVRSHSDPLVRMEAVPRLKLGFQMSLAPTMRWWMQ